MRKGFKICILYLKSFKQNLNLILLSMIQRKTRLCKKDYTNSIIEIITLTLNLLTSFNHPDVFIH